MGVAVGADGLDLLPNFVFIYCLFSDFVTSSDYIAWDNVIAKWIGKTWKETVEYQCNEPFWQSFDETEELSS
jgi:hypothetical protein